MPFKIIVRCRAGHQRLVNQGNNVWYEDVYHNVWAETVNTEEEGLQRIKEVYFPSKEIERAWLEPRYPTPSEELAHAVEYMLIVYKDLYKQYAEQQGHPEWKCDNIDAVIHANEALKRAKEENIIHD